MCRHGELIRQAEQAEVEKLKQCASLEGLQAQLHPKGVSASEWERVIQVRREEPTLRAEELRRLGSQVQPDEIIASTDEIVVRRPENRRFLELGTACVHTAEGYRYLSGKIEMVLQQLWLLLILCGGLQAKVVLLGDGTR